MAVEFKVTGPCEIWVSGSTSTLAKLGRTNNDNLPRVAFTTHVKTETDVAQGASPACVVGNNQEAVVSFALAVWDQTVLDALKTRLNGSSGPNATVGKSILATSYTDGGYFILEIRPVLTGKAGIKFFCCFADGEAFVESQFGNQAKIQGCSFRAIPNPVDNILYELTTT